MADREFILRLKADSTAAVKSLGTIEQQLIKLNKQRAEYIKLLKKSNGDDKEAAAGLVKVNQKILEQKRARTENQKVMRQQISLMAAEKGSMNAIAHELAINVKRYKAMGEAQRLTGKAGKNLAKTIRNQEGALRRLDAQMGRSQRNVGNYAGAMRNVAMSLAGAFGVTLGLQTFTRVVTDSIRQIAQFEKNLSSLSAITGLVGEDLEKLGQQAINTSARVTLTATDVVAAYERIGSIRPELLKNSQMLAMVAEDAIILSEATGGKLALEDAARATAVTLNQFQLASTKSTEVINALAAGSKFGSSGVVELADGFDKFGSVAQTLNITVEQSVGLLETLAEQNLVGSEAGLKLRNVLLILQKDSKNWTDGNFDLNKSLERLSNNTSGLTELTNIFGVRNVVAANILSKSREKVISYTEAVTGTATALEQQVIQNDNLIGSSKFLASAWEAYILSLSKGGGILKGTTDLMTNLLNQLSGQAIITEAEAGAKKVFKAWADNGQLSIGFLEDQIKQLNAAVAAGEIDEMISKMNEAAVSPGAAFLAKIFGTTELEKDTRAVEERVKLIELLQSKLKELQEPPKDGDDGGGFITEEDTKLTEKVHAAIIKQMEKDFDEEDEITDSHIERNLLKIQKKNEEDLVRIQNQNDKVRDLQNKIEREALDSDQEKEELKIEQDFEKAELELERIEIEESTKTELLKLLEEERAIDIANIREKYAKKQVDAQTKSFKKEERSRRKNAREMTRIAQALSQAILGISNDTIAGRLINIGIDAAIQAASVLISSSSAQARNIAQATAALPPPLNAPLIAAAIAQNIGLAAVAKKSVGTILASAAVGALGAVSKAENGGFLVGNSHSQGGIRLSQNVEAEGGEYISTKRTMANPQLRELTLAADEAGKSGQNLQVGVSEERIAAIAAEVVASVPVTLLESRMTELQREVELRESKFKS